MLFNSAITAQWRNAWTACLVTSWTLSHPNAIWTWTVGRIARVARLAFPTTASPVQVDTMWIIKYVFLVWPYAWPALLEPIASFAMLTTTTPIIPVLHVLIGLTISIRSKIASIVQHTATPALCSAATAATLFSPSLSTIINALIPAEMDISLPFLVMQP